MSAVRGALDAHQVAAAGRLRAEREMGERWRDAAARIVEQRFLASLAAQDRDLAAALQELDSQVDRALRMVQG